MKLQLTLTTLLTTLALLLGACTFAMTPAMAEAHEVGDEPHDMHSDEEKADDETDMESHSDLSSAGDDQIAQLQAIIAIITQIIEVMQHQAALESDMSHDVDMDHEGDGHADSESHDHGDTSATEGLAITVETHEGLTHVHISEDGEETNSFFVEADITDNDAVYDAIVAETELIRAVVEAAATFMTGDEEMADESHGDMDLSGVHIMGDGTIMLGDGTVVSDAIINDDGMIVLGDGTEVEPVMDLRQ